MSDWSDDYSNTNLSPPEVAFDWDSFITGVMGSLPPTDQRIEHRLLARRSPVEQTLQGPADLDIRLTLTGCREAGQAQPRDL